MLKLYTVVSLYYDNKQVRVDHVKATKATAAASLVKRLIKEVNTEGAAILSVFAGHHVDEWGEDELMED